MPSLRPVKTRWKQRSLSFRGLKRRGCARRPDEDLNLTRLPSFRSRTGDGDDSSPRLRCVRCRAPITTVSERIDVNGRHIHVYDNPADITFEIGCFRKASGCIAAGRPTTEFTWFAGFAWQIALCRTCGGHLGWSFSSAGKPGFYGLIIDRLVEDSPEREKH